MIGDGTQALYRQIADELRDRINTGDLQPGDALPTEADLVAAYGVARWTVRDALKELENEGLLRSGRPRRVAQRERLIVHVSRDADHTHPGEKRTKGADAWVWDMRAAGREPAQQIIVVNETASAAVARRLGVEPGARVVSRRLIRQAAGRPHNLITFWFPAAVARGTILAEPESITEGSVAWLEKTHGPLAHEAEVDARMPSPAETEQLRIPAGVPVQIVTRASSADGRAVVTSMAAYPADRTTLKLDL